MDNIIWLSSLNRWRSKRWHQGIDSKFIFLNFNSCERLTCSIILWFIFYLSQYKFFVSHQQVTRGFSVMKWISCEYHYRHNLDKLENAATENTQLYPRKPPNWKLSPENLITPFELQYLWDSSGRCQLSTFPSLWFRKFNYCTAILHERLSIVIWFL